MQLHERGKRAVVACSWLRGHALGDFALYHHDRPAQEALARRCEQVKQDLRGDVVRQVADDIGCLLASDVIGEQRGQVGLQNVRVMDRDLRLVAEAEGKFPREGWVELDAVQPPAARREQGGDGPMAWTDFDGGALTGVAESVGDADAGGLVDEEVLAEFGAFLLQL